MSGPRGPRGPEGQPGYAGEDEWKQFLRDQDDRLLTLHGPIVKGLTKFKRTVYFGLAIALIGMFIALIAVRVQSDEVSRIAETNRQILVRMAAQQEANCKARDKQVRLAAASELARQKFLRDVGKKLAKDGNSQTAKFVADTLKKLPPIPPPPNANCDFSDTLKSRP